MGPPPQKTETVGSDSDSSETSALAVSVSGNGHFCAVHTCHIHIIRNGQKVLEPTLFLSGFQLENKTKLFLCLKYWLFRGIAARKF